MFLFFLLCLVGLVVLPMMNAIRVYQQNERYHEMGISSSDFDEFQAQIRKQLKMLFLTSFYIFCGKFKVGENLLVLFGFESAEYKYYEDMDIYISKAKV